MNANEQRCESRTSGGCDRRPRQRGSVIVIVMITLLFAVFALVAFMEKASVDLLVDQREALNHRLRAEAYSALEVTLGVLQDFSDVSNGLHSPAEGWTNPLEFAGYQPTDGRTIEVIFDDESGKISLPRADAQVLTNLFLNWGIQKPDAEALADALLGWMKRGHTYTTAVQPNYEMNSIPYEVPGRPLKSFNELAAIDKVRDMFFDTDGRPNEYWKRFADSVSLFDFARPNINGAKPDTLAALGQFDPQQQSNLGDFFKGAGNYQNNGPGYFQSSAEAARIAGPTGNTGGFDSKISALRITLVVRDGRTEYKVSTVIAPPNGAKTVEANATTTRTKTSGDAAQSATQQQQRPDANQVKSPTSTTGNTTGQNTGARNLKYPFTLLEIRENDEIPPPPAPPANPLI